jgi:hypothetical protein
LIYRYVAEHVKKKASKRNVIHLLIECHYRLRNYKEKFATRRKKLTIFFPFFSICIFKDTALRPFSHNQRVKTREQKPKKRERKEAR